MRPIVQPRNNKTASFSIQSKILLWEERNQRNSCKCMHISGLLYCSSSWFLLPCPVISDWVLSVKAVDLQLIGPEFDSKNVIFNLVLLIGVFRSSRDNALWWMPQDLTDDKSTLVQEMAWCRQATTHYLSQCWLSSLSPYGAARPQWVNTGWYKWHFSDDIFKCMFWQKISIFIQISTSKVVRV